MFNKPKKYQGIYNLNLCTAVTYKQYFYHFFETPFLSFKCYDLPYLCNQM